MKYQELKEYYKSIVPIDANHSDNKVKCILNLLQYLEARTIRPDLLIIDDLFHRDFTEYLKDEKFKEAFDGIAVVMVERFGRTRFELQNLRGHK